MTMKRKPNKYVLAVLLAVEVIIAALTFRDLKRRPPEEIRGSKRFWRVISLVNPGNSIAYWLFGRRRGQPAGD
jgi:hypothetical protein